MPHVYGDIQDNSRLESAVRERPITFRNYEGAMRDDSRSNVLVTRKISSKLSDSRARVSEDVHA